MHLLLVEDDVKVALMLRQGLREEGFEVTVAHSAEAALEELGREAIDLIVLDLGLPGAPGLTVLQHVRSLGGTRPVIIVTAQDEVETKVAGLDAGADDYVVKPFAFTELVARIRALLRRSRPAEATTFTVADLRIDVMARAVTRGGAAIDLTPREFDLLLFLVRGRGQIVSRELLGREVWKVVSRATPMDNVIDVHISHLREKVDRPFAVPLLHTVRGVGFVLKEPDA